MTDAIWPGRAARVAVDQPSEDYSSSSLLLSSLELSDTKSMGLEYEHFSEQLHISVR